MQLGWQLRQRGMRLIVRKRPEVDDPPDKQGDIGEMACLENLLHHRGRVRLPHGVLRDLLSILPVWLYGGLAHQIADADREGPVAVRQVVVEVVRHMVEVLLRFLLGLLVAVGFEHQSAVGKPAREDDLRTQLHLVAFRRMLRVAVAFLQMRLECRFPVVRHATPSLLTNPLRVILVELLEVALQVSFSRDGSRDLQLPAEWALERRFPRREYWRGRC